MEEDPAFGFQSRSRALSRAELSVSASLSRLVPGTEGERASSEVRKKAGRVPERALKAGQGEGEERRRELAQAARGEDSRKLVGG